MTSKCRSCQAEILWILLQPSGSRHPIEAEPRPDGTILVVTVQGKLEGTVLSKARRETAEGPLYRSHFASCPNSSLWRKPK
jgi:hypothetical protein